jgi:poly(3-hydroxybutyrate) depolymerase
VTETARVAKTLLKAFYGTEQKRSYFVGCSTGGRMGVMEALHFPTDFDGINSGECEGRDGVDAPDGPACQSGGVRAHSRRRP